MLDSRFCKLTLFALGFRPFFLLAGIFAVVLMAIWAPAFVVDLPLPTYYYGSAVGWHSHEMIFGYAVAVIAGFLLTAARNWTGMDTASGMRLFALSALWLVGRLLPFFPTIFPGWLIAAVDLLFLPALALSLAPPLLRSGQTRNLFVLPLLGAFALADLLVHMEILGFTRGSARAGIFLGLNLIILLIVIMGGRVIPFFTERALAGVIPRRRQWLEWSSIGSAIGFVLAELFFPDSPAVGIMAALAAASNGVRLAGWYTRRFWAVPLLWVLHAGYGWVVVGFCLNALAFLNLVPPQMTVHAFTVGGIGVLTLGMMARVALGHTGRPLEAAGSVTFAFVLINLAAVVRGLLPLFFLSAFAWLVALSGGLWVLSFAIFLEVYAPILILPRVDGRPG